VLTWEIEGMERGQRGTKWDGEHEGRERGREERGKTEGGEGGGREEGGRKYHEGNIDDKKRQRIFHEPAHEEGNI
jgi:hypothetical protein